MITPTTTVYGTWSGGAYVYPTVPANTAGQYVIVQLSLTGFYGPPAITIGGSGPGEIVMFLIDSTYPPGTPGGGVPDAFIYANMTPPHGATIVPLFGPVGTEGSYVITVWSSPSVGSSVSTAAVDPGSTVTTSSLAYAANQLIVATATDFSALTGSPSWSNGDSDNLIAYEVPGSGNRPVYASYINPGSSGTTTYTSPTAANSSNVVVWCVPAGGASGMQIVSII